MWRWRIIHRLAALYGDPSILNVLGMLRVWENNPAKLVFGADSGGIPNRRGESGKDAALLERLLKSRTLSNSTSTLRGNYRSTKHAALNYLRWKMCIATTASILHPRVPDSPIPQPYVINDCASFVTPNLLSATVMSLPMYIGQWYRTFSGKSPSSSAEYDHRPGSSTMICRKTCPPSTG